MRRVLAGLLLGLPLAAATGDTLLDLSFDRMYRLQFSEAQALLKQHIDAHPSDPLGYSVRSAAFLFQELDRLSILESEFFGNDKRILEKKELKPDPALREGIFRSIDKARELAKSQLDKDGADRNALLALCIAAGIQTDYLALIEKRQLGSLTYAKESQGWAVRLLKIDPSYADAYLTTGLSEYLLGSVPFFVRWFVKFEQTQGSKVEAIRNLEKVVQKGRYFRPFAKVLLAVIHLREKRPVQAEVHLSDLNREFPENPLFRKELQRLQARRSLVPGDSKR